MTAPSNDSARAGGTHQRLVRLSVQQCNALSFVLSGYPFSGCVTKSQMTGRKMTLWSLVRIGFVDTCPWRVTVAGMQWIEANARNEARDACAEKDV